MQYYYLLALLTAFTGVLSADYRLKLVLFRNARLAGWMIAGSVVFFLVWDILGLLLNVFSTNQEWVSGFVHRHAGSAGGRVAVSGLF